MRLLAEPITKVEESKPDVEMRYEDLSLHEAKVGNGLLKPGFEAFRQSFTVRIHAAVRFRVKKKTAVVRLVVDLSTNNVVVFMSHGALVTMYSTKLQALS